MNQNKTPDEKRERLSDIVRVAVLVWSAAMLTVSYIKSPDGKNILDLDPTFIASVFSGSLAGFGITTIKNGSGTNSSAPQPLPSPASPSKRPKKEEPEILSTVDTKKTN